MAKKYFVRIDGEQRGPYELERLPDVGVTPDTYVWCKGMEDWTKARHDAEICRLYRRRLSDLAHPGLAQSQEDVPAEKTATDENMDSLPWNFRGYVEKDGTPVGEPLNTKPDYSMPPRSRMVEAVLVTLFCSLIGVVAIYYAYAAQRAWNQGKAEEAYDLTRSAKMWVGIAFFIGIIGAGVLLRLWMQ